MTFKSKFIPTQENIDCLNSSKENRVTKINALAGTGKTSTLKYIADNNQDSSILYLAFNKKMADDAKYKFPDNTECRTVHSLAYSSIGFKYASKLKRPSGRYVNVVGTPTEISKHFKLKNIYSQDGEIFVTASYLGLLIQKTVNIFEYSDSKNLNYTHLPFYELIEICNKHPILKSKKSLTFHVENGLETRGIDVEDYSLIEKTILSCAQKLWELRINLENDILCTHDTYLKLYQLGKPDLGEYDYIFLDEAQDSNSCILDIVMSNKDKCKIVMVGDHNQAIYGWRGSINLLKLLPDEKECKLTTSYRFGSIIASMAGSVIENNELKGVGVETSLSTNKNDTIAMIFRGNTSLILKAVELLDLGKSVEINTDIKDFMKLMNSAIALQGGDMSGVKHDKLIPFVSWDDLVEEAENDIELSRIITLVEKHNIKRILAILNNYKQPTNPDFILTTAHKAKGLEFDQVVLADDFKSIIGEDVNHQEKNLVYVAITRAKKAIELNCCAKEYLSFFWSEYKKYFGEKDDK